MFTNSKPFKQKKIFQILQVALLGGLVGFGVAANAVGPDNVQIKDDDGYFKEEIKNQLSQGAFDLTREDSTIVSAATELLAGTAPGIRTIATVNNAAGEVRVCSKVTVNYQIIDIDGDWDGVQTYMVEALDENGEKYYIPYLKTSDTIEWGFKSDKFTTNDPNNVYWITPEMQLDGVSANRIHLTIPDTIEVNGELHSTVGMSLVYSLRPNTMVGSFPNESLLKTVIVDDLTQGKYLEPGAAIDSLLAPADFAQSLQKGEFDYPGLVLPDGRSFAKAGLIGKADPADCLVQENEVQVVIYSPKNEDVNLIGNSADPEKTLAENLTLNPNLSTIREYRAKVVIKEPNGKTRPLTKDEYNDTEAPFTWNVYYPADEQCLQSAWNTSDECVKVEKFVADATKFNFLGAEFSSDTNELNYAWFKTQESNAKAKVKTSLEQSEQGAFLSVSFGYKD